MLLDVIAKTAYSYTHLLSWAAVSTHKGVNQRSKDVTQAQQQRREELIFCVLRKYKVYKLHQRYILRYTDTQRVHPQIHRYSEGTSSDTQILRGTEDVPLVEFMYLVFTRMTINESYGRRRLGSLLLCLCDVFRALMNSLVC